MDSESMALMQVLMMALFAAVFLVFWTLCWFLVMFLLARIGGWTDLAKRYPDETDFQGPWQTWQTGAIGWSRYRNCLWVGVSPKGLHLRTLSIVLFRAYHPPLCIPWSDFGPPLRFQTWGIPWVTLPLVYLSNKAWRFPLAALAEAEGYIKGLKTLES